MRSGLLYTRSRRARLCRAGQEKGKAGEKRCSYWGLFGEDWLLGSNRMSFRVARGIQSRTHHHTCKIDQSLFSTCLKNRCPFCDLDSQTNNRLFECLAAYAQSREGPLNPLQDSSRLRDFPSPIKQGSAQGTRSLVFLQKAIRCLRALIGASTNSRQ